MSYYLNAIDAFYSIDKKESKYYLKRKVKGGFIEAFIVGNMSYCEITKDYKRHSDSEYHYEMSLDEIKIFKHSFDGEYILKETLKPSEFFTQYFDREFSQHFEIINKHVIVDEKIYPVEYLQENFDWHLMQWIETTKKEEYTGNNGHTAQEFYKVFIKTLKVLPDYMTKEAQAWHIKAIKDQADRYADSSNGWTRERYFKEFYEDNLLKPCPGL